MPVKCVTLWNSCQFKPPSETDSIPGSLGHANVEAAQVPFSLRVTRTALFPIVRTFMPGMVSPTRDLGRVMTDLAMSDGERLEGSGVSGDGRTLNNRGFRRIAGL